MTKPTKQEIENATTVELENWVMEYITPNEFHRHYSIEIAHAFLLVYKMIKKGWHFDLQDDTEFRENVKFIWHCRFYILDKPDPRGSLEIRFGHAGLEMTPQIAICKAALQAILHPITSISDYIHSIYK